MKICFFLHRQFAHIGHNLAKLLSEEYGVQEFCGYVQLRSSYDFLVSQKDIAYTGLLLDEDVHEKFASKKVDMDYLKGLEREYGIPNLFAYIAIDRILMCNQSAREYPYNTPPYSYEDTLKILQIKAKALSAFLKKEKPDALVVSQALSGTGNFLLYTMAKKIGIPVWSINMTGIKHTYVLSDHHIRFPSLEKKYRENLARGVKLEPYYGEAKKIIEEFRKSREPYYAKLSPREQPVNRNTQLRFLSPAHLATSISFFVKMFYRYYVSSKHRDYTMVTPLNYVQDHVRRKMRNLVGAKDLYDNMIEGEKFVFFPLQTEPESSLNLWAPFKTDQLEIIRQISKSLPIDYKLYVKEHPLMVQFRPRAFYKEIKKNLNVALIDPSVRGTDLAERADLLITITGTLGLEATFLKKPVIVLGNIWYDALSFIKKCSVAEDLPYLIKEQLERPVYNEEELLQFIAALLPESAHLDFPQLWEEEMDKEKQREGLRPLAVLIAKKLGLTPKNANIRMDESANTHE